MSVSVWEGLIGVRTLREIEWYRLRSARIAIAVSRMKKADIPEGRCPQESRSDSLESARRGESRGIGLGVSACL